MPSVVKNINFKGRYNFRNWGEGVATAPGYINIMNDSCIVKDTATGRYHRYGIKGIDDGLGVKDDSKLYHSWSTDLRSWTFVSDLHATIVRASDCPDLAKATVAPADWQAVNGGLGLWAIDGGPNRVWAPYVFQNPMYGVAGSPQTSYKWAMAVTFVGRHRNDQTTLSQLIAILYTTDLDTGPWVYPNNTTVGAVYYPELYVPGTGPTLFYYNYRPTYTHTSWRDPFVWNNHDTGGWEMAVATSMVDSTAPGELGTEPTRWSGAIGRLLWTNVGNNFSLNWNVKNAGGGTPKAGASYARELMTQKIPEGPYIVYTKNAEGSKSYFIGCSGQWNTAGGQTIIRVPSISDTYPYNILTGAGGTAAYGTYPTYLATEKFWKRGSGCGNDANYDASRGSYYNAWGNIDIGIDPILDSENTGKWLMTRFFSSVANYTSSAPPESWWPFGVANIGTIDFSQEDTAATTGGPLFSWESGLDRNEWQTVSGNAFTNQPAISDAKDSSSVNTSDKVVYGGYVYRAKTATHVASSANAPSGSASDSTYWSYIRAASGSDLSYYPQWTPGETYEYVVAGSAVGITAPYTNPFYIDTSVNKPTPGHRLTDGSGSYSWSYGCYDSTGSKLSTTGYIRTYPWQLSGNRIAFRMGGGDSRLEFIALVNSEDRVVFKATNSGTQHLLYDVLWDTSSLIGDYVTLVIADMDDTYPEGWIMADEFSEWSISVGVDPEPNSGTLQSPIAPSVRETLEDALGTIVYEEDNYISVEELVSGVASAMDTTVDALDEDSIKRYAIHAAEWLFALAPESAVSSVASRSVESYDTIGISLRALAGGCMRIVDVMYEDGDMVRNVPPREFYHAEQALAGDFYAQYTGLPYMSRYSKGSRIWSDLSGYIRVTGASEGDSVWVRYIRQPSWVGENLTIPYAWKGIITLYAAAKAKAADEENEQATMLWQQLKDELSRFPGYEDAIQNVGG